MGTFASGIAGYAKRTGLSIDNAVIAVCAKASTEIIKKTPVDTGRAIGAWVATIDAIDSYIAEGIRTEDSALAQALIKAKLAVGHNFYLTNNLPYILKLEYGSSKQAPQGMVRLTVAQISEDLKKL